MRSKKFFNLRNRKKYKSKNRRSLTSKKEGTPCIFLIKEDINQ